MPKSLTFCGTVKADSKEEAVTQFMDSIHGNIDELIYADTDFPRHKGLRSYYPPNNDFEILMTCIAESLHQKPKKLYLLQAPIEQLTNVDMDILVHLQMSYEYAKQNKIDDGLFEELARNYKGIAMNAISTYIGGDIPKIALKAVNWNNDGIYVLESEGIPFELYDDGRIGCKPYHIDQIKKILKEAGIYVRISMAGF